MMRKLAALGLLSVLSGCGSHPTAAGREAPEAVRSLGGGWIGPGGIVAPRDTGAALQAGGGWAGSGGGVAPGGTGSALQEGGGWFGSGGVVAPPDTSKTQP